MFQCGVGFVSVFSLTTSIYMRSLAVETWAAALSVSRRRQHSPFKSVAIRIRSTNVVHILGFCLFIFIPSQHDILHIYIVHEPNYMGWILLKLLEARFDLGKNDIQDERE